MEKENLEIKNSNTNEIQKNIKDISAQSEQQKIFLEKNISEKGKDKVVNEQVISENITTGKEQKEVEKEEPIYDQYGGYYDDNGYYRYKNGTYYDNEGNYFDEYGGMYDAELNYISAEEKEKKQAVNVKEKTEFNDGNEKLNQTSKNQTAENIESNDEKSDIIQASNAETQIKDEIVSEQTKESQTKPIKIFDYEFDEKPPEDLFVHPSVENSSQTEVKRTIPKSPGRPRKKVDPNAPPKQKRPRGRPKKVVDPNAPSEPKTTKSKKTSSRAKQKAKSPKKSETKNSASVLNELEELNKKILEENEKLKLQHEELSAKIDQTLSQFDNGGKKPPINK